jgi:hypothetical protein
MRINATNRYHSISHVGHAGLRVEIDGVEQPLIAWLEEFNEVRGSFQGEVNGVAWQPYTLDEITRDDLATEFAFQAYSEWDGTGEITL